MSLRVIDINLFQDGFPDIPPPDMSKVTVKKEFMDELGQLEAPYRQHRDKSKIEPTKNHKEDEESKIGEHFLLEGSGLATGNKHEFRSQPSYRTLGDNLTFSRYLSLFV